MHSAQRSDTTTLGAKPSDPTPPTDTEAPAPRNRAERREQRLATPHEVADHLGIPPATLYQWRHRGIGPRAARVGRHLRYRWADVDAWVDRQLDEVSGA